MVYRTDKDLTVDVSVSSAVLIVPIPVCVLLSYICWQVPQGVVYRTDKDLTVDVTVSSAVLIVPIPVCVLLSYICWQVPQGVVYRTDKDLTVDVSVSSGSVLDILVENTGRINYGGGLNNNSRVICIHDCHSWQAIE